MAVGSEMRNAFAFADKQMIFCDDLFILSANR